MNHQATTSLTFTRPAGPEGVDFRLPALDHVSDRQSLGASPRAARHVTGSIMAVLAGWEPPSAATVGIADTRRRLLPVMTPGAWERFCIKFEAMLEGYEIEVAGRNGNRIASYDEYMLLRRMTAGIECSW